MQNADSTTHSSDNPNHTLAVQNAKSNWQNKLMPWMIAMPTVLILLFVYLATRQMEKFNAVLDEETSSIMDEMAKDDSLDLSEIKNSMDYVRWVTLVKMEERSLNRRYTQGGALLSARLFTKYLGFFTGMILTIVGAVFIIGKLQEKTTEIEGEVGNGMKGKLSSSSPGIIFGVLGTLLMLSTIFQHSEISVSDQPLFLNSTNLYLNTAGQNANKPGEGEFEITTAGQNANNLEEGESQAIKDDDVEGPND